MPKRPVFFDFGKVEVPKFGAWDIITVPIRLLGRAAIESNLGPETINRANGEVTGEPTSDSQDSVR
jgi:hypothetical protein